MELQRALLIAEEIERNLSPYCEKINIAGSCRRGDRSLVKDIEIVCLPKAHLFKPLFGEDIVRGRSKQFIEIAKELGEVVKGSPLDGKYVHVNLKQGIMLDLFMPESRDYYRQYAIRTGSADYSFKVLAAGWRRKGWCGTPDGLRRVRDCKEVKKSVWKCINPQAELPPVWQSEHEFFDWIGVRWIKPSLRNV